MASVAGPGPATLSNPFGGATSVPSRARGFGKDRPSPGWRPCANARLGVDPPWRFPGRDLDLAWLGLLADRDADPPSQSGRATADERVQAIRDRRAADRAVDDWARQNSALLRSLAGHLSSLDDLDETARQLVDLIQRALAGNDTATLLRPLTHVAPHLAPTHPTLAERINQIIEVTDRLRRETHDRRSRPASQG